MHVYLCFLVCLHFSIGRYQRCGFLDFRIVSISSELNSLFLSMCIDAPESTTNSRSSGNLEVDAGAGFNRRVKRSLISNFELVDIFRKVYSVGASFLVQTKFRLVSLPQIWERTDFAREVRTFLNGASRWTLSFPIFLWCHVPLESLTV